mgnify:CR=1 FL=1
MDGEINLVDVAGLLASGVFGSNPPAKRTLLRWVAEGRLPSYKVGRLRRFDPREVAAWIRRNCRVAACHE